MTIRRMTSFGCELLLILNLGILAQTHGGSRAKSTDHQQTSDLSRLAKNSFCPGEGAFSTYPGYMFIVLYFEKIKSLDP
jgi:hypothetical protein